jgi:hypothetical protein
MCTHVDCTGVIISAHTVEQEHRKGKTDNFKNSKIICNRREIVMGTVLQHKVF